MNTESSTTANAPASPSAWSKLQSTRLPVWMFLVTVLIILLLLVWKQTAISKIETDLRTQLKSLTEQASSKQATLLSSANAAMRQNSESAHVLMGTTLAWSIRGEMIRGNLGQIDEFFADLVRNERVKLVVLADPEGKIILASDRKLQDAVFADHFPPALLAATTVSVHAGAGNAEERFLLMPIQGLNSRLGSALLVYQPEPLLKAE